MSTTYNNATSTVVNDATTYGEPSTLVLEAMLTSLAPSTSISPSSSSSEKKKNNKRKREAEEEEDPVMKLYQLLTDSLSEDERNNDFISIDVERPMNKGKDRRIPSRETLQLTADVDSHHKLLTTLRLPQLLKLMDMAVKSEPSGCVYDSDDNIVVKAIKLLVRLDNLPDVERTPRFRTHNFAHQPKHVDKLTGDEPLSELIPLLVYFIGAKGVDCLSKDIQADLKKFFIKRFKSISEKPNLKRRQMYRGKKGFHTSSWTIYDNAAYEENDVTYDGELVRQGRCECWLREYGEHSDYDDE